MKEKLWKVIQRMLLVFPLAMCVGGAAETTTDQPSPTAGEILQRTTTVYSNAQQYQALVYRRKMRIRVLRDGASSDDYRIDSTSYRIINLKIREPFNIYADLMQFGANDDAVTESESHPGFVMTKAGRDMGRFAYADAPNEAPPPIPDDQFMSRLRNGLEVSGKTLVESALFTRLVNTDKGLGLVNPELIGGEILDDLPVYKIDAKTSDGTYITVWIDKASGLIVRTLAGSGTGVDTRDVVECIYKQTLTPKLTADDFSFKIPDRPDDINASVMGFSELTRLNSFIATHSAPPLQPGSPSTPSIPSSPSVAQAVRTPPAKPLSSADAYQASQKLGQASAVVISGNHDSLTGFTVRNHDVLCVVTNLQALLNNDQITVRNLQGQVLPVQGYFGAAGRDILLIRLSNPATDLPALAIMKDTLKTVKTGERVMMIGNRPSGGPQTEVATIRTMGPSQIEVDAAYYRPGGNGGPIISAQTGEVLGVTSYSDSKSILVPDMAFASDSGVSAESTQPVWVGYQLETVSKWESIDPAQWRTQMQTIKDFRETSMILLALIKCDFKTAKKLPRVSQILERYQNHISLAGISESGKKDEARTCITFLASLANQDVKDLSRETFYDYFRTNQHWDYNINAQIKLREQIIQSMSNLDTCVGNLMLHYKP